MMTMGEFIRRTDEIKPNAYSLGQKAAWLGEMEGQIWTELLLQPAGDWDSVTHAQRPLLLPEVWQRLYSAYLAAMIDLANGEYTKYSNAMALYNGQVQEFAAWYGENFRPADRPARWMHMGSLCAGETKKALRALPEKAAVLAAVCRVTEAFAGGESLSAGTENAPEALMQTGDIRPGTAGSYRVQRLWLPGSGARSLWAFAEGVSPAGQAEFWLRIQPGKD